MRKPDFVIGGADAPYMLRWWLIPRNRFFNIYLHQILRSDDDRALHDHPWWNVSILLRGAYREITPDFSASTSPHLRVADVPTVAHIRRAGSIVVRRPTQAHRLEVIGRPVWSLFLTGPTVREWGFHCQWGWRTWKEFVSARDHGSVGRGCE